MKALHLSLLLLVCLVFDSTTAFQVSFKFSGKDAFTSSHSGLPVRRSLRSRTQQPTGFQPPRQLWVGLRMAVTPIGPFCPFRSSAALAMEDKMERLSAKTPEFAMEMSRLQLDMSLGKTPPPDALLHVANELEREVDHWEQLMTRMTLSQDFQTREYAKLTQAHLNQFNNSTVFSIGSMVRWQAQCMRAMAENAPPPFPPPEVNLTQLMELQQQQQQQPNLNAMAMAEKITASPFDEDTIASGNSPTIKNEYEKLCRDHQLLIEFGSKYENFDPAGKLVFLDEIDKIQDRWDIFFTRFQLMGALNPEYLRQCNAFLASMNMDEPQYRKLLDQCHLLMRLDAEKERNQIYSR